MKDAVQILLLEDNSNDAELIQETLLKAAIPCNVTLVRNRSEFLAAIERHRWNLILADYSLPDFDGLSALKHVVEKAPGTAFIFVSAIMGEDLAVETLKSGATDYVLKHRLERLGPCVRRALLETEEREKGRQAELNLRRLFETARDGILLLDGETGTIVDANPAVESILGYGRDEMLGKKPWEAGPFRDITSCQDTFRSLQEKEHVYCGDVSLQTQSGTRIHVELTGTACQAGEKKMIELNMRDITERKKAQTENIRLAQAIEQAAEGVVITDVAGCIQYVNPAFTSMTGYSRQEAIGRNPRLLKSGKHDVGFYESLWGTIMAGNTWHGEITNQRKDGRLYTAEMTIAPVRDLAGAITNFISFKQDVTERRRASEDLLLKTALLEAQSETTLDGILVVDPAGRVVLSNRQFAQMWNVPDALAGTQDDRTMLEWAMRQVEDPDAFVRKVKYLYAHQNEKSREEVKLKDGRVFDRYSSPLLDSAGKYWRRIWYFRDITDRKRADETLRLTQFSIDRATLSAFWVDPDGRFLYVNDAACKLLGYSRPELLSMTVSDVAPDWPTDVWRVGWESVKASGSLMFETQERSKSGRMIPVEISANYVEFDGKAFSCSFVRDITERKRTEAETAERSRLVTLAAETGLALARAETLRQGLQQCAEAVVRNIDAAFARIWTLNGFERMLELQASAGMYTHLDGAHGRVPVGKFKIGRIAESGEPHLTNTVLEDPWVGDPEWARREGMVAFAGYPLMIERRVVGV
jgi:PAS domain S-box-containing protein